MDQRQAEIVLGLQRRQLFLDDPADFEFVGVAENNVEAGDLSGFLRAGLGVTPGEDHQRILVEGQGFLDGQARIGITFGGDGAGVDDEDVCRVVRPDHRKPLFLQDRLHFGSIVLVGAASQCGEGDSHYGSVVPVDLN